MPRRVSPSAACGAVRKEKSRADSRLSLPACPRSPAPRLPRSAMGRVRTKTVKRSARVIVERFYSKLALDFDTNKRVRAAA